MLNLKRLELNLWQWGAIKFVNLGVIRVKFQKAILTLVSWVLVSQKGMLKLCGKLDCPMKFINEVFLYKI